MADRVVAIDCFHSDVDAFDESWTFIGIDVIRASTTAVTGVNLGRRCLLAEDIEDAMGIHARLENALLVGELEGNKPYGFDLQNSPAQLAGRDDVLRPMILLSTSGTVMMLAAARTGPAYVACLRNYAAQAEFSAGRHSKIALLGAGTRGEFRREDQICCALIADLLLQAGYQAKDETTSALTKRLASVSLGSILEGKSAGYLRDTGQVEDLDYILDHVNDVTTVYGLRGCEVVGVE